MNNIKRVFVEKKKDYAVEAKKLLNDLKNNLQIKDLQDVRIINRYDIEGISDKTFEQALNTIFSEPPVDIVYKETLPQNGDEIIFAIEFLPGQYDQRADSATQCIKLLNPFENPVVRTAKVIILNGVVSDKELEKIKKYSINSVDSREAQLQKPTTLELNYQIPEKVQVIDGFIDKKEKQIVELLDELGLAMSKEDLLFTQQYFKNTEKRNPTLTEIRVLDTYWSDHCRHTTFNTKIENVTIDDGFYNEPLKKAYDTYLKSRKDVYKDREKDFNLMDIALMGVKSLKQQGKLHDLEESDEINACSIIVPVDVNGEQQEWLVMFKNETHNHPTEIEPFGGAATCLGGAIRDPLSGRSYVYQAMRITGSGNPTEKVEDTLENKLPQKKIALESAHGYSSYGNQIGLATGKVVEIYDDNYKAKHMELGAVIAAAPRENVIRGKALKDDIIILLGGRTGRDGCGGATGSSKAHTAESIHTCGAEVQKGNPPIERKIQRLFRNSQVSKMIKKCNDFGAGGVSVAIGELADGLIIDLDLVPKKYAGLDGTELSISESQERMAVVVEKENADRFIEYAQKENLEATKVAVVTDENRLVMNWKGNTIVNISRDFLDTNGAVQSTDIHVVNPNEADNKLKTSYKEQIKDGKSLKEKWFNNLQSLNVCSQKGLVERFDSSIGAGTVLMPFGGKTQLTPIQSMAAKIPVLDGDTTTGTLMSFGYNPAISTWSPFYGALYAVIESVSKVVATGGDHHKIRFTFQEYFERLNKDKERWGKPFSALLGSYYAQEQLGLPSIGGKDSMSGTFNDINVPPTLVSFAVDVVDVNKVISPEFKQTDSKVVYIPLQKDKYYLPDFEKLDKTYSTIHKMINEGKVLSASAMTAGGIGEAVSKMSFGNQIGITFENNCSDEFLFNAEYGSLILELPKSVALESELKDIEYTLIGLTNKFDLIEINGEKISIQEACEKWQKPLEKIYPTKAKEVKRNAELEKLNTTKKIYVCNNKMATPKVFIPVFPGTNCEYDTAKQFKLAGAEVETVVFRNLTGNQINESIEHFEKVINESQIIALAGGFSAGDEPEGSGKFITSVFKNPKLKQAVMNLISKRDGLIIGICNGFQALIKLGLVPYGEIRDLTDDSPTLTYNTIGRHVSCMVETKIISNSSPWLANVSVGDTFTIPISHGEGRFVANDNVINKLFENGQVATQYVGENPNGSVNAIEGIISPDGRVLGKMGHSERIGTNVSKNIFGNKDQQLFKSGVEYFTK